MKIRLLFLLIVAALTGCKITESPDGTRTTETDAALVAKVLDTYVTVKAAKVEPAK